MIVRKGKAIMEGNFLRCTNAHKRFPKVLCHHALVRRNTQREIAGEFKCPSCHQIVEVIRGEVPTSAR